MEPFTRYSENYKNFKVGQSPLPGLDRSIGIASHLEAGVYMMNVANKSSEDGRELNEFTRSNIYTGVCIKYTEF